VLQDWTLEKQFKSVPGVVDVSSFGGETREYQVRVDPESSSPIDSASDRLNNSLRKHIRTLAEVHRGGGDNNRSTYVRLASIGTFTTLKQTRD